MSLNLLKEIRSVTELKRKTREILQQIRKTGRPVIITLRGKADAVLVDARNYEKHLAAFNLARLLAEGEGDIAAGRVRGARTVLRKFKNPERVAV